MNGNANAAGPKGGRKKAVVIAAAAVVIIAAVLAGVFFWSRPQAQSSFFDTTALEGILPGKTHEEVVAELNRVVEEGMFNIAINSNIVFESGDSPGDAGIENIAANRYHMTVEITLDDTGESVYKSKGIKPGQYIQYIQLTESLPAGTYNATALFTAYAQDDGHTTVGQAGAKIVLQVLN